MKNSFQFSKHRQLVTILVLLPGIIILFIQYIWKMLYMQSAVPGIYWLFVFLDWAYFPSIIFSAVAGAILLSLWGLSRILQKKNPRLLIFSLSIFLLSIAIICTFPITYAQHTVHMQTYRAGGRVYYLGAYPLFDINFYVAECDPFGVFCRTIFRSWDVIDTEWKNSRLRFDVNKNELILEEPQEGVIFTYTIP